jgi:hypothetical protein
MFTAIPHIDCAVLPKVHVDFWVSGVATAASRHFLKNIKLNGGY